MSQDYVVFCYRFHLCKVNRISTKVPEGKPRPMPIPKVPFKSLALHIFVALLSDKKCDLILLVLDSFSGKTYLFPVSKNIDAKQPAEMLLEKIFTLHGYPLSRVSNKISGFTTHFWR
jgi:hypothetical protein